MSGLITSGNIINSLCWDRMVRATGWSVAKAPHFPASNEVMPSTSLFLEDGVNIAP